jgi:nicotinate-nucleotide adenylyltransferase
MADSLTHAAILGGAFDPITKGHIQIANLVLDTHVGIDEVWIMPCFRHVFDKHMESASDRLAMCRLAAGNMQHVKVIDYEIRKKFAGGTYFLLKELLAEDFVKSSYTLDLVIGLDNANGLHQWIEHEKLMKLVRFIVIPRAGVIKDPGIDWYTKPPHMYLAAGTPVMEVSSTQARTLIKENLYEEAGKLLDETVLRYIIEHKLYV